MISLRNHFTNLHLKLQGLLWEVCDRHVLLFYLASASPSITLLPYFCYKIQSSVPISVHICSLGLLILTSKANDHFLLWLHHWLPKPNLSPKPQFQSLHSNLSPKPQFQSLHGNLPPKPQFQSLHSNLPPKPQFQSLHSNLSSKPQFQSLHGNLPPKSQFQYLHSNLHLSLNSNPSTVAYRPSKPSYLQTEHTTLPLSGKLAFLFLLY